MRHQIAKRVFYLDEDSWALMVADNYDAQGKLWRVQESSVYPAPEIPACVGQEFVSYDLSVGRYIAENATQERPETDWLAGPRRPHRSEEIQPRRAASGGRTLTDVAAAAPTAGPRRRQSQEGT